MLKGFDYLTQQRKLTKETIETFHLGYCDPDGALYFDSGFPDVQLNLDPRFYDTALFPIFDLYNQVIGVSARALSNQDLKYVNTIYPKTQHLYGLNVTWENCLKENKVYVVEGNVDVLRLYQSGIRNVVGMLGSVLKEKQLILLSRFVENVVVVPDGDNAGRRILKRVSENREFTEKLGVNIGVLKLPEGTDPDTFMLQKSVEDFKVLEKTDMSSLQEKLKNL